jgi:hypothetical protein
MKRLGLLLSVFFVFLAILSGCSQTEDTDDSEIAHVRFKKVILKNKQGREVTLEKDMPVYSGEVSNSGVHLKINIPSTPNEVHVIEKKTNEEILSSTWKEGYPVIPYPNKPGLHQYQLIAKWNEPNEFHVHEAIAEFEIENR